MDILAHGLWSGAAYKAVNNSTGRKLNIRRAVFWGVFPDLFAFTIPITWLFLKIFSGEMSLSDFPAPTGIEPPAIQQTLWPFQFAANLYNYSHSLVIFFLVFTLIYFLYKRPVWEMGGWLIHILIDIPTHTYLFYPTPALWPISNWKFDGFSWGQPWFLILNYTLLLLVFWFLRRGGANS